MLDFPLIINLAPTGAVADQRKNPSVPITADSVVADVAAAAGRGASVAHLHVRDEDGAPSSDPERFADIIGRLRSHPSARDLVLCASTSGRHGQTDEQRAAVLNLPEPVRPDMASLTLGSLNFPSGASVNAPETIRYLASEMDRNGVKPELEVFDAGMIEFARILIAEKLLKPPYYFNIILGNVAGFRADIHHLAFAIGNLPDSSIVSVGGIGRAQRRAVALGLATAHGIRTGLEDNLWADWSTRAPATNSGLVESAAAASASLGRPVATPSQARFCLGIGA
jgi:3-keto-5-aminohexanoate cleavage enzyme